MVQRSLIAIALFIAAACGPSTSGDNFGDDDGGNGSNGSNHTGTGCSSDLHDVTDAQGNVVMTCPDDQGCSAGQCIPACEAAAASQGSVGCDFTVAVPSFLSSFSNTPFHPGCFAVFLANNWPIAAAVTITRAGITYDASTYGRVPNGTASATGWPAIPATGIASSDVGVLFMSHDPLGMNGGPLTCPIEPMVDQNGGAAVYNGQINSTGIGESFHITTTYPVSAYDIMPYGGAPSALPSAELLLPTTALGTNYVAAGPEPTSGNGWAQVIATQDNTTVTVTPKTNWPGGTGVAAAPANTPTTYTVNAGQFIQWQDVRDAAGAVIQSTAPVGFTAGTGYLCLSSATSSGGGCDSAHQMIPPVSALGSEYVAIPYATRRADLQPESIKYRFVGAADGTTLSYSPAIAGAPATIGVGEVVQFESTQAFTVTSQDAMHPFYVGQYMSGWEVTGGSRGSELGDEEYVNILPPAQWLASYVFFTDPTYGTTNLAIARKADASGNFADVTVDCLGVIGGWQPVGTSGQYQITNVDLGRNNMPVGTCTSGRHTASSSGAFTIMVWGLEAVASYAYPAGGNVGKINPVVVIGRHP